MDKDTFIRYQKALDMTNARLALLLRKSEQSVSNYRTGRQAIPAHVETIMKYEIERRS